jgi:hypothetical protein
MTTKVQRMRAKLEDNKRKQKILRFPETLLEEGAANVMRFQINLPSGSKYLANGDYKKAIDPNTGNAQTSAFRRQNSFGSIAKNFSENYVRTTTIIDMFMPANVQTSYNADWGQEELGIVGSATDAATGLSNVSSWDGAASAWSAVKNTLGESAIRTGASAIQSLSPFNVESLRKAATSTVANPYMEVLFNGVQNRTFSFTFKMIPQNKREQDAVKAIVDEFKFHRAPEMKYGGQTNYMLFPSEFDIQFLNREGENPWLFKISTCAMTEFSINYSPEGQYASHADGSPFATEITVGFTELIVLTKESHREGY